MASLLIIQTHPELIISVIALFLQRVADDRGFKICHAFIRVASGHDMTLIITHSQMRALSQPEPNRPRTRGWWGAAVVVVSPDYTNLKYNFGACGSR